MRIAVLASLIFIILGVLLIPYAGLQEDEAAFTAPFYLPQSRDLSITVFHHEIPLMIIPYAGTLKTLLYWPLIRILQASLFLIRLPAVLAGGLTIILVFRLAERIADRSTAIFAAVLLAADPIYLLTNTFDWGPVALQHLAEISACLSLVQRRTRLACFLLGLALWDKSIFLGTLAGLAAGALIVYPQELRSRLRTRRAIAYASLAFLLGASPLILYNVRRPNATLRSGGGLSLAGIPAKWIQLQRALDGSALFGDLAAENAGGGRKQPQSAAGRAALAIPPYLGAHHSSLGYYALILSVCAAPLWWRSCQRRRAALFVMISLAASLAAMLVTRNAGVAVHHMVLLWPLPQFLVAITLASLRPRPLAACAGAVLVIANLFVLNQYFAQFERNGAAGAFTDAILQVPKTLQEFPEHTVYVMDWGMSRNLAFLTKGRWHIESVVGDLIPAKPDASQQADIQVMLNDTDAVFLNHVPEREEFHGVGRHLIAAALAHGYQKELLRTIPDTNQRPVFEIFRLRPAGRL